MFFFTCPKHTPSLVANAETMCIGLCLFPPHVCGLYSELRSVLPFIAMTSSSSNLLLNVLLAYSAKTFSRTFVSILASTRRIVSLLRDFSIFLRKTGIYKQGQTLIEKHNCCEFLTIIIFI